MRNYGIRMMVLTGLLLSTSSAQAQDQKLETAKNYFDQGQNLYLQGKYLEASKDFMKAYETKKYPAFLFNVAVCHEKNRDFLKALELYERYLKEDPHSQDRELVLKRIKEIRKHLNPPKSDTSGTRSHKRPPPNLPPVKTKGLVVIESKPEGAAIYLEDKKKGIFTRTPYTGSLPPGKHTVIIEMKKYKTEQKTFTARADRMVYLYFALSLEKTRGWIEVKSNIPNSTVYIDSKDVGAVGHTPFTGWVRPGKHTVFVERPGYETLEETVEIVAGDVQVVQAMLKKVTFGWLKITGKTTKGSVIKVNGKPLKCPEYPCQAQLSEGAYKVELEREGYKSYTHDVTVSQANETQLAVKLNPTPSRIKAYVSFGVAAALLSGAIAAGVISKNRKDSLEDDLTKGKIWDSSDARISEGKVSSIVANSLFGLGGIVGALGVYYMLRDEGAASFGETRNNPIAVTPVIGPNTAGLSGKVRF